MNELTHVVVWLNTIANALGRSLFPISWLPGWLSATLIAVATGVGMLGIFKYTSNQRAIKRVRRDIRANLLAVKLFKDNIGVGLRSQSRVLFAALRLLLLAVIPMLVMSIPMALLLAQLALWYQARPISVGQEAVVTVTLNGDPGVSLPKAELTPSSAIEDLSGPVRILSKRQVCWNLRPLQPGHYVLQFRVEGQTVEKELVAGNDFSRVSVIRPEWSWWQALENPLEKPFAPDSAVRSIEIDYPTRGSWTSGTDKWVIYWFAVSFVSGFCFRGLLRVNL